MNSKQVADNLIRKKASPRMGLHHEGVWKDTKAAWAKDGYPVDEKGEPQAAEDVFPYDCVSVGGWFDVMPLRGHEEIVEETSEWVVRRNGAGAAFKWWKNKSGTPEHVDFRMTSREIWDRDYRPHLLEVDPTRVDFDRASRLLPKYRDQGRWTYYGHLFTWEHMRQSLGDICLYESLLLDPDWIHDFSRVYTDFFKAHFKLLFDKCGVPDGIWLYEDMGYKNGLFCSPKTYAELVFPYHTELIEFFHSYNLPVVLHSCGNITAAIPQIIEAGYDALHPMEVKAGCDLFKFAEQYGDKLAFVGGMDARIFETNDRELVGREVIRITEGMRKRGAKYLFGSDHSISTNVNYDTYKHAIQVFQDNCSY